MGAPVVLGSVTLPRDKRRDWGFTLIEVVVASLVGAMVITGAFVVLLSFRQQARMAWAERAMDQYMYSATRFLTEHIGSALTRTDRGVSQNNYAVWNFTHGDLTKTAEFDTLTGISASRTEGLLINGSPFDPAFPPRYRSGRRGVPMWDRRDSFEFLYLGIEHPKESSPIDARAFVEGAQIIITMRMRYRHRERPGLGFLFGPDYARTRTHQTRVFLRNLTVRNPRQKIVDGGGSGGEGGSALLGWSLASGKTAEEYLTEKWQQKQSRTRRVRLP